MIRDTYTLLRIIREKAEINLPADTERHVQDILAQMGTDSASDAIGDVVHDDPNLINDIINDNPEAIVDFLKTSPEATNKLVGALDNPEVMNTISSNPEAIEFMSSHYEENPEDIPDALVRQISQAVGIGKDTPKGDIQESYENMLASWHMDGHPWSGTLQDLASVQGKSFGGGELVDPKHFDDHVKTSVKFATGKAKSPLHMTERKLREVIRNALQGAQSR
jgi:uncharacterized protein YukE